MRRDAAQVLDELLVLRCQAGDDHAFEQLVGRWHPRLLGKAYRLTGEGEGAQEVTQESWLAIVRALRGLEDAARFGPWAYRILSRKAADWIRRRRRRRRLDERIRSEPTAAPSGSGDAVRRMRAALAELPEARRALLSYFYLEGRSLEEVAALLAVPVGTVKSRLFHARRELRNALEESS